MKRFIPLVLAVLALAAVPAAFADDGSTSPAAPAPTAQQGQGAANARQRLERMQQRIQLVGQRFARHCGSNSGKAPQACLDFAKKAEDPGDPGSDSSLDQAATGLGQLAGGSK